MKKIVTLCLLLSVWTAGFTASKDKDATLNIGTFNIRLNVASDGDNAWPNRVDRVRDQIRYHEYDIFGVQEALGEQMADLSQMEEYAHVGVGRDDGIAAGEFSAIFYRKDRFKIIESDTFWLSETPSTPSLGWDASLKRICTWAKMQDLKTNKIFYYFNTHFDHISPISRRESANLLLSRIKEKEAGKYPVICTGDFNSTPGQDPIVIMSAGMLNAKKISKAKPYTPGFTFPGFAAQVNKPGNREDIDYIFVNDKVEVEKYAVITDSNGVSHTSDHWPLIARVKIR